MVKFISKYVLIFVLFQIISCYFYYLLLIPQNIPTNCASRNNTKPVYYNYTLIKYIHQSWKTNILPPSFKLWSQSWINCYPDWQYKLWTDTDNRELIRQSYPWFLSTYDLFPRGIHRADMMRAFYMHHYGGIYADLDTECLKRFNHLLENASIVFGAMDGHRTNLKEGYTQNSFMYSIRGHSFWILFIRDVMELVKKLGNQTANYVNWPGDYTGPGAMTNSIKKYRQTNEDDITVYPPVYFNPYSWMYQSKHPKCKTLNQMIAKDYLDCRSYFVNRSYVVQYHAQSWSAGMSRIETALKNITHP